MAGHTPTCIWYELLTTALDAAVDFYTTVVGWTAADQTMTDLGGMRYTILSAAGRGESAGRWSWTRACSREAPVRAGLATSAFPRRTPRPARSPTPGARCSCRRRTFRTSAGSRWWPTPGSGDGGAPDTSAPGQVGWHELYSASGQEAAFQFYARQFGWDTITLMDMGPMGHYRIFGGDGTQIGGMMDKPVEMPVSAWSYYFNVKGIDAAVARLTAKGGRVLMGPHEVPGGSWIVQAIDPQGAAFSLVSPTR